MSDYLPQSAVTLEERSQTEDETHSMQVSTNKNKLTFDDLPFEIRKYIFEFCGFREYLDWKPKGDRRPNPYQHLLIALLPQLSSYQQLLQMSYELDWVHLDRDNKWCLGGMPATVMGMIKKLHITVEEVSSIDQVSRRHADSSCITCILERSTNIREVRLELDIGDRWCGPRTVWTDWVTELPKWITGFKSLVRLEFVLTCTSWGQYQWELESLAMRMLNLVSGKLGVDMRSHRVSVLNKAWARGDQTVWQKAWEWKAMEGQVIDCSKLICKLDLD